MQAVMALEQYRVNPTPQHEHELGLALRDAQDECQHGEWDAMLNALGITWDNKREWARRMINKALASVGQQTVDLPEPVAEYYSDLVAFDGLGRAERAAAQAAFLARNRARLPEWPAGWQKPATSRSVLYEQLKWVGAPQRLCRKVRSDAGQPRAMSPALADVWRVMRSAPNTRPTTWPQEYQLQWDGNGGVRAIDLSTGEALDLLCLQGRFHGMQRSTAIRLFRHHCPDARGVGDMALRRVDESIPAVLRAGHTETQYLYTRQERGWLPPHVGYWAYDMTVADVRCWSRSPNERPFRPYVVGIVDQLSHAPFALLATKEAPSKYTMKSALRQAIFPKGEFWPVMGFPFGLYGDHGEVQKSKWMQGLATAAERELGRPLRIESTPHAYRSWSNGSAETLFKDLHNDCDCGVVRDRWPVAYLGHRTDRKPAHLLRKERPCWVDMTDRDNWYSLPTLEEYQALLNQWVADYLLRTPTGELAKRIGFSRLDFWRVQTNQQPELRAIPDESVVLSWLLESVDGGCLVHPGGRLTLNGAQYQDAALIGYERTRVDVRFDFHDLASIRCFDPRGKYLICEARRSDYGAHESQQQLRARAADNRQRVREVRASLELAAQNMHLLPTAPPLAPTAPPATQPRTNVLQLVPRTPTLEPVAPQYEERLGPDGTMLRIAVSP